MEKHLINDLYDWLNNLPPSRINLVILKHSNKQLCFSRNLCLGDKSCTILYMVTVSKTKIVLEYIGSNMLEEDYVIFNTYKELTDSLYADFFPQY